ncbi:MULTISPECIES: GntR family transcriptional regulator [unclassified Micromonospora]|uniref:GntR family transcriptional regulator n=1 Tax=unclassified Micromonospora TaxID=2617518 RepID=UPI00331C9CE8
MSDQAGRGASPGQPNAGGAGESLADYATRMLRDRLVMLEIPPGAPIDDDFVGRELGVGRTPVREAIKRLETERLVTVFPRRGTFAAPVNLTDLAEISEIRAELEPLAASRAAQFVTPDGRGQMKSLIEELRALDLDRTPVSGLLRHDREVHRSIYAANGNGHLAEALTRYGNLSTRIWCMVADRLANVGEHITEHIALLTHIMDGDAQAAADSARAHVTSFERLVRSAI